MGVGEGEGAGLGRGKGRGVVQQETSLGAAGGLFGWILCFPDLEAFVFLHMLSVVFLSETLRSNIAMPLFCLDLGYQSGNHWRLIGFFGSKPKEKDEVGVVVTGEIAFSVSKGALVPLLKFGNKGLQRIAIVRAWLGAHGYASVLHLAIMPC
ncbi:hypothetical protein SLEP1_g9553 [Rubroshorea leprosula]|uniref:Uncharacterized protein n=1 Tax=Rubroshorea leprosula TaxID=152421 RepID=A0AAV5ID83_9ROSI|nr:hypothetical protein SLEP1_g9553 [Rubroshorea leprosula]